MNKTQQIGNLVTDGKFSTTNKETGLFTFPLAFKKPFSDTIEYTVVRKFYEKDSSTVDQELSLIKYNNSYRTSNGTSFAQKDNQVFDVLSSLSGKVLEIKESPLYGRYVVLEHDNKIKSLLREKERIGLFIKENNQRLEKEFY